MPSIQLGEGGVVVVGLSIFHVLLACLFPPNNSRKGGGEKKRKEEEEKKKEKHENHALLLHFCRVSVLKLLFISLFFFSLGLSLFLGEAFLLASRIFRVKGSLCALLLCCFAA